MEVLFFGIAKDIVGNPKFSFSDDSIKPKSVAQLKAFLIDSYPSFSTLTSFAVAVNSEYASDDVELKTTDEIAIIPPVSGG